MTAYMMLLNHRNDSSDDSHEKIVKLRTTTVHIRGPCFSWHSLQGTKRKRKRQDNNLATSEGSKLLSFWLFFCFAPQ